MRHAAPLLYFLFYSIFSCVAHAVVLSPETILNKYLKNSPSSQNITLRKLQSKLIVDQATSVSDTTLAAKASYTNSRIDSLSGFANEQDKTYEYSFSVTKQFLSGTTVIAGFEHQQQDSILNPSFAALRDPTQYENLFKLQLRQNLTTNVLGRSDRGTIAAARAEQQSIELNAEETREDYAIRLLENLWQMRVVEVQIAETISFIRNYERLVKTIRRKKNLGAAGAAELPQARAELNIQRQNLERIELRRKEIEKNLFTELNIPLTANAEIATPPLPATFAVNGSANLKNRQTLAAQARLEQANQASQVARNKVYPQIELVLGATFSGVEPNSTDAFREARQGKRPAYRFGLEATYPLFSDAAYGNRANKELAALEAENEVAKTNWQVQAQANIYFDRVRTNHALAKLATQNLKLRREVVEARERSYRQGRVDLQQLILDYNARFQAATARIEAVAQYFLALYRWQAFNDVLLEPEKTETSQAMQALPK